MILCITIVFSLLRVSKNCFDSSCLNSLKQKLIICKMSRSFKLGSDKNVSVSLNERTIYIKVNDNVNYTVYESNVELRELRVSLDLEDAYKIIVKCLDGSNSNYKVNTSVNSGTMKITFNAIIEGFLKINFDIILREKIMSNDGQLSMCFNKLEQQQVMAIESLTQKCKTLEDSVNKMQQIIDCCQIFMSNIYTPTGHWCDLQTNNQTQIHNISAKEITMTDHGQTIWKTIAMFYQLEKLTINNFNAGNNITNLTKFNSATLQELVLNCTAHHTFNSLTGIENFPKLEILTILNNPGLKDVVKIISETPHKIKTLKFQGCSSINVVELQTYCQVNGIFLAIS